MIVGSYTMDVSCDTENCPAKQEFVGKDQCECFDQATEAGWTFGGEAYCSKCTKARKHEDSRLCEVRSLKDATDIGHFASVRAVCTCGREKKYYVNEIFGYFFVCNGVVIMKYHEECAPTFNFFLADTSSIRTL